MLARTVAALAVIGAVLAGLRYALARVAGIGVGPRGRDRSIAVLDLVSLPHDCAVAVLRVGTRRIAVGLARGAICALGDAGE